MNEHQFREAVRLAFGGAKKMSNATGLNLRSIRRWSSGEQPVPDGVRALLREQLFEHVGASWDLLGATDPAAGATYAIGVPIVAGDDDGTSVDELARAVAERSCIRTNATLAGFERRYDPTRRAWHWYGWGNEAAPKAAE